MRKRLTGRRRLLLVLVLIAGVVILLPLAWSDESSTSVSAEALTAVIAQNAAIQPPSPSQSQPTPTQQFPPAQTPQTQPPQPQPESPPTPPVSSATTAAGLRKYLDPAKNPIVNPSLEKSGGNGMPDGWLEGKGGKNNAAFTYPVSGHNDKSAIEVSVSSYSSGDAKWYFKDVPVHGGEAYVFSDYYISNTSTWITAQFTSSNGATGYFDIAHLPSAAQWTQALGAFYVPDGTVSLTVFHLLNGTGILRTDDYSLSPAPASFPEGMVSINFDDGWQSAYDKALPILQAAHMPATFYIITQVFGKDNYMTKQEVLNLQADGEEVGAHTRTHANLPTISPSQMENEIAGSLADLRGMGVNATTFAYPYGAYNEQVDAIARQAGFASARTTQPYLNFPESDPYLLSAHTVMNNTSVAQVEDWINEAVKDKQWLILVFHEMDTGTITGDSYGWPSDNFQRIVNYLSDNHIKVDTNANIIKNYFQGK